MLLLEITQLLESMAVQIRYRALPLAELFGALNGSEFLETVGAGFHARPNINYRDAWNNAVDSFSELAEEREILLSIGNSLGGSDVSGQIAMLELNKELLQKRLGAASETAQKKGAMYRSVGLLTGLGLAIMVI